MQGKKTDMRKNHMTQDMPRTKRKKRKKKKKTDMRKNHMKQYMPRTKIVSAGVSSFPLNSLGVRNLGALKEKDKNFSTPYMGPRKEEISNRYIHTYT